MTAASNVLVSAHHSRPEHPVSTAVREHVLADGFFCTCICMRPRMKLTVSAILYKLEGGEDHYLKLIMR